MPKRTKTDAKPLTFRVEFRRPGNLKFQDIGPYESLAHAKETGQHYFDNSCEVKIFDSKGALRHDFR